MNGKRVVVKCCVCGREKTDQGWEFRFAPENPAEEIYSHAFCSACYATELMKLQLSLQMPATPALYQ